MPLRMEHDADAHLQIVLTVDGQEHRRSHVFDRFVTDGLQPGLRRLGLHFERADGSIQGIGHEIDVIIMNAPGDILLRDRFETLGF